MENEIKVGDWIRTSDGYIGKIIEKRINEKDKYIIDVLPNVILQLNRDFVKHSHNLIDIIEERRLCKWERSYYGFRKK